MFLTRSLLAAGLAFTALPAIAHEFWFAPLDYQVDRGERLQAHFINGEEFEGTTLSYFDRSNRRFDIVIKGAVLPLSPRSGDRPALDIPVPIEDGLIVVVHESTPSLVTYREWEKFLRFTEHKDFAEAAADHEAAGWSKENFKESYTRHIKTLIAAGDGSGSDQATGLKTEFVALTNPYEDTFDNDMKVRLLLDGAPRADAQVEVFDRAPDGTVNISLSRTDGDGIATVPVAPGHTYLFDAVVLQPFPAVAEDDPVWQTLWAALTFQVPQ
ncbi:MAG: DUF4198 domain-containing protein [Sulfitobacter sp.]|nr:DUF4198 domain-containing protein [Sulfitobacter sp.]